MTREELVQSALRVLIEDQTGVGVDVDPDFWLEAYMQRKEWERRIGEIIDLAQRAEGDRR